MPKEILHEMNELARMRSISTYLLAVLEDSLDLYAEQLDHQLGHAIDFGLTGIKTKFQNLIREYEKTFRHVHDATSRSIPKWEPGDQIIYMPSHANGDLNHPDCERGFVMSMGRNDLCFCRFWHKGLVGKSLRTIANSEAVSSRDLIYFEFLDLGLVDRWIESIKKL